MKKKKNLKKINEKKKCIMFQIPLMIPDPDPDSDHPLFHLRHPCVIPVSSPLSLSLSSFSLFREYFGGEWRRLQLSSQKWKRFHP